MKKILKQIIKKGEIRELRSERGGGMTRQVHIAEHEGKKYVVRICPDEKTADKYLGIYRRFEKYGFFPKFYEKYGKYLLFEYLEGRDLREEEGESREIIRRVGKIAGIVNNSRVRVKDNYSERMHAQLEEVVRSGVINKNKAEEVRDYYEQLARKVKPRVALDLNDLTSDNMRLVGNKVYFVDIEAIKPRMMGFGIIKAFLQWFKDKGDREAFLKGYKSVHSTEYLTEDYMNFCYLNFLIQRIDFKSKKGEKDVVKKSLRKLDRLLAGERF